MKAGVSTACLYPLETEKALQELADMSIKNVEIFVNTISETEKDFINKIKKIKNENGINVSSIHPFTSGMEGMLFFSKYERRFYDGIELYKRYFNMANELGAKIIVIHGAYNVLRVDDEAYFERFEKLMNVGQEFGVVVAQENVERCKSGSIEFIEKMKKAIPDVKFVLDVKQCIRANINPMEMLSTMNNNIFHIHISDNNQHQECLPLQNGTFNICELLKNIKVTCENCNIIIELYRNNFKNINVLQKNYFYLKNLIIKS